MRRVGFPYSATTHPSCPPAPYPATAGGPRGGGSQVLQRGEPPSCEGCCRSGRCCQGSCERGVELGGRVEGRPRGQIQGGGVPCPYPFVPAVLPAPLHSPPRRTPPPYDRPLVAHGG